MAEAEEKRVSNHFTKQMNGHPRDLLQRFMPGNHFPRKFKETADDEEEGIELSLGLSLNGRFGVDPKRAKELTRSSSISDFMLTNDDDDNNKAAFVAPPTAYAPLIRTCSLPAETGEQWRKRKEIQSLRRLEAKRKRLEKLKNVRTVSAEGSESKGERGGGMEGLPPQRPSSQGSIGSQGTGSSGISESESQPTQGMNRCTEARSPASVQSQPKQNEQKPVVTLGTTEKSVKFVGAATMENPSVKVTANNNEAKEIMRNEMADMPYVSTRGVGPNGKRIEGFLYRFGKGEEVRIVCVCHGSFLSPAEFVKHAGGGDVAHPLKHIVVNPSSLL